MKIWHLDCEVNEFENLGWIGEVDLELINSFDGRSKVENWEPISLKRMYDRPFSNTPGLTSNIPIFDKKAVEVIKELIKEQAEILPVNYNDGEFYIINVLGTVDCVNYDKSKYKTFRDGVRIMRFEKYEFIEEIVVGKHIFRLKDEPLKRPFVSDEFRNKIVESGLTGFIFDLVWDSESK